MEYQAVNLSQAFAPGFVRGMDDVGLDGDVVADEFGGVFIVGQDAPTFAAARKT